MVPLTNYEPNIDEWIYLIKGNHIEHCKEQELALDNNIIPVLERKDVYIDADRIAKGLSLQKYFPYDLLPWERYQFAIITGVFLRVPGMPYDDIYFHEVRDIMRGKQRTYNMFALVISRLERYLHPHILSENGIEVDKFRSLINTRIDIRIHLQICILRLREDHILIIIRNYGYSIM